jgi:hypothetical protein
MKQRIHYSTLTSVVDRFPRQAGCGWKGLVDQLSVHTPVQSKDMMSLISPALYPLGARRSNKNVQGMDLVMLDVDHADEATALAHRRTLEGLGCAWLVYSSYSHGLEGKGWCYRVVIPLARRVSREDWPAVFRWLRGLLPGVDPQCGDLSRSYYRPSCPLGGSVRAFVWMARGVAGLVIPDDLEPPEASKGHPGFRFSFMGTLDDPRLAAVLEKMTVRKEKDHGLEVDCPLCSSSAPEEDRRGKAFVWKGTGDLRCQRRKCRASRRLPLETWAKGLVPDEQRLFQLVPRLADRPMREVLACWVDRGTPRRGPAEEREVTVLAPRTELREDGSLVEAGKTWIREKRLVHPDLPGELFVVQVAPGAGKTHQALEMLLASKRRAVILAPTHRLMDELIQRACGMGMRSYRKYLALLSRGPDGKHVCCRPALVEAVAEKGWSPRCHVCWSCELKKTCKANKGHEDVGPGSPELMFGTHAVLTERLLPSHQLGARTVTVIDELMELCPPESWTLQELGKVLDAADLGDWMGPAWHEVLRELSCSLASRLASEDESRKHGQHTPVGFAVEVPELPPGLPPEPKHLVEGWAEACPRNPAALMQGLRSGRASIFCREKEGQVVVRRLLGDVLWHNDPEGRLGLRAIVLDATASYAGSALASATAPHACEVVRFPHEEATVRKVFWSTSGASKTQLQWGGSSRTALTVVKASAVLGHRLQGAMPDDKKLHEELRCALKFSQDSLGLVTSEGAKDFFQSSSPFDPVAHRSQRGVQLYTSKEGQLFSETAAYRLRGWLKKALLYLGLGPGFTLGLISHKVVVDSFRACGLPPAKAARELMARHATAFSGALEDLVEAGCSRLELAHYHGLRGLDHMKGVDVLCCVGLPVPNPASLLGEAEVLKVSPAALIWSSVEAELVQAFGRQRAVDGSVQVMMGSRPPACWGESYENVLDSQPEAKHA